VRVYHARDLLRERLPIAEAAMRTGFADSAPSAQRHLHRHFKRIIGVTPGQYRKHVQDR
jgi:transcriptional regulator GlxA family with amidase domain